MSTKGYIYVMTRKETMGQVIKCDSLHYPTADRIAAASAN